MKFACVICGDMFDIKDKTLWEFIPKVCSKECFADFVKNARPAKLSYIAQAERREYLSEMEIKFASLLDSLGFIYEYEPAIFEVEAYSLYLPDFRVRVAPDRFLFFEVKGKWLVDAKKKFRTIANRYRNTFYLINKETLRRITNHKKEVNYEN